MKVKFKLQTYSADNNDDVISIINGSADHEDINKMLDYLLKLKEERYNNGQRNIASNS